MLVEGQAKAYVLVYLLRSWLGLDSLFAHPGASCWHDGTSALTWKDACAQRDHSLSFAPER